jgi:hypothetical protein
MPGVAVSVAARWDVVALYDLQGKFLARVRVPVTQGLPEIILWGNRYFVASIPYGNYREGRAYMVPLEHMHTIGSPPPTAPPGGPKK